MDCSVVVVGGTRAAAQLLEGWSVYQCGRGGSHLHDDCSLAGKSPFLTYSLPSPLLQTRHKTVDFGFGTAEGGLFSQKPSQSESKGGIGTHRTGTYHFDVVLEQCCRAKEEPLIYNFYEN